MSTSVKPTSVDRPDSSPPDALGHFGPYGGRYVPETLMAALEALTAGYEAARKDPQFQEELAFTLRQYVGRPTPLYYARRLSERLGGPRIYLKREDLCHTGAHKINNAVGQILLARRLGKARVIAETGAGQHGVATATVAALLGLRCEVYMGTEDMQRQALNVVRMRLLGAKVTGVDSGSRTLKDAINEAMRDWVTNVDTTHYVLGSVLGADPYPRMVRDFQAVIGEEARRQILEAEGRLPDCLVACVGGGSNSLGLFFRFLGDAGVRMIGVEAGGLGIASGRHAARFAGKHCRDPPRDAELRAPGSGRADPGHPLHLGRVGLLRRGARARLSPRRGPHRVRGGDGRGGAGGFPAPLRDGGHHPGPGVGPRGGPPDDGRAGVLAPPGGRSQPVRPRRQGRRGGRRRARPRRGRCRVNRNRIDQAFARLKTQGRKGLIPFLAAGDPSLDITEALVAEFETRGADIVELGVPFSDPLADGVVNQRAYQRALHAGINLSRILESVSRIRARSDIPIVLMSYINPIHRYGLQRFPSAARDAGVDGLIVSDCPPEEMGELHVALTGAEVHPILLIAPTSPARRISLISAKSRGYIYYVSLRGVTGPRDRLPEDLAAGVGRVRALTKVPLAVGFGISTPEQARAVAELADAVIVGSAVVATVERSLGAPDLVARAGEFVGRLRSAIA